MKASKVLLIVVTLLIISSCRNNSYTPTQLTNDVPEPEDINFIQKPSHGDIYYLGDKIDIKYRPFSTSEVVDVYIEKKGAVRYIIGERLKNDGSLTWQTNSDTRPSVQYKVRIVNPDNPEVFTLSEQFGLLRKNY